MKEKILVINDDEAIRDITKLILENKGYQLSEAENGRLGIVQAIAFQPDLILLDIMMPEMDGFETCQKLKADPTTQDIPVLFFSSLTDPKDKIRGLELGAVDFINNIVDKGELLARVQTHLKIQALTRELQKSNEELIYKQKALDADLNAAATIQRSFLSPTNLKIGGLHMASFWYPMHPLGGDIFNVIENNSDQTIIYMVDVSGHDVPSALVTISISQYLQQHANDTPLLTPKQMMLALEAEYPLERFNRYFTAFYLILNRESGEFKYSCAAHPPAVLLKKKGGYKLLDAGGTIIGLDKALPFDEGEETLEFGDKLFIYTDGIIEMHNANEKQYGADRFYALLESMKDEPIDRIVKMVYESLKGFGDSFQDDISLLGIERIVQNNPNV